MTWSFLDKLRAIFLADLERAPEPPQEIIPQTPAFDSQGWATVPRVTRIPSRPGWYYKKLDTKSGLPLGVVCHYTATKPGTATSMAVRRRDHDRKEFDPPPGSWHFTVAQSGEIIQQLSLKQGGFHAGSATAKKLPIGWANHVALGIELEGHGDKFPTAQVESSKWLWRAIIEHCAIKREHAMYEHRWIDPTRRKDPGRLWMAQYSPVVLDFAYGVG